MRARYVWVVSLFFVLLGCEKFEYNPYVTSDQHPPKALNSRNIERLLAVERTADDTITIVFSADSQRFYGELDKLVNAANGIPGVDFFVVAGDLSEFGVLKEFEWIEKKLSRLNMPFLCVIGNHDLLANGRDIYRSFFGPENFSFRYKRYKFIMHDTNGREYDFAGAVPHMEWLSAEVKDSTVDWFVGVSHVPPYSEDFDPSLEEPYRLLLANTPRFELSLHGHLHSNGDSYYYNDQVRYIGSNAVGNGEALLLKLIDGKVIKQRIVF